MSKSLPECWGHRGASAAYPENTLASFEAAIRDGAEGIESDDVVVMFHDPSLDRTTNGKGLIREQSWHGPEGMEHLRTIKEPKQSIPTFANAVELLMRLSSLVPLSYRHFTCHFVNADTTRRRPAQQPENQHVQFNVDVKVQNDPARLFGLMHAIISAQAEWETKLAPRLLIGLWHPTFIPHAKTHLPYCRRSYIGQNVWNARKYFWDSVDVFSMKFDSLTTAAGEQKDCQAAGKKLMVWTVNEPVCMVEASRWNVDVILTDVTKTWLDLRLRQALQADYDKTASQHSRSFLWTRWKYYPPYQMFWRMLERTLLESVKGPFDDAVAASAASPPPPPAVNAASCIDLSLHTHALHCRLHTQIVLCLSSSYDLRQTLIQTLPDQIKEVTPQWFFTHALPTVDDDVVDRTIAKLREDGFFPTDVLERAQAVTGEAVTTRTVCAPRRALDADVKNADHRADAEQVLVGPTQPDVAPFPAVDPDCVTSYVFKKENTAPLVNEVSLSLISRCFSDHWREASDEIFNVRVRASGSSCRDILFREEWEDNSNISQLPEAYKAAIDWFDTARLTLHDAYRNLEASLTEDTLRAQTVTRPLYGYLFYALEEAGKVAVEDNVSIETLREELREKEAKAEEIELEQVAKESRSATVGEKALGKRKAKDDGDASDDQSQVRASKRSRARGDQPAIGSSSTPRTTARKTSRKKASSSKTDPQAQSTGRQLTRSSTRKKSTAEPSSSKTASRQLRTRKK
ncbi:hypothetical protein EIP91_010664 [Steccherinum ochraceum]|uniref:GP-PDE domain-containing protein n=1 Tax=Steccherinum ochraceum TaxID=92696 RepID=A0A4R0RSL7_9APHY|nr:hypothetical protein EIP91_010664 [Steccherinum ochraceum]